MIGRIYRIVHLESELCYIGSTTNELRHRWQKHKGNYNAYLEGRQYETSIYPYFEEYGIEQFKILLVKEYDICDRRHLEAYEQLYINKFRKTCVNVVNPFYINKLSKKHYRVKNIEACKERDIRYREANRETIRARQRRYREQNLEAITAKKKEKHNCDCGGKYTNGDRYKHFKTKKHQAWVAEQAN